MKLARGIATASAALALTLLTFGTALAQLSSEPAQYLGHIHKDLAAQNSVWDNGSPSTAVAGDVYSNLATALGVGITSTDLSSTWGDEVLTTNVGTLLENDFTIFNSPSSAGPLLGATVAVSFYDANTSTFLGGYSTAVTFGSGLPAGFFATVTVTGLSSLNINLNVTDLIILQQVVSTSGAASRLGVVLFDPPSIGSSPAYMYIDSSTIGAAGFYNLPPYNANPGYRINEDITVPAGPTSWGKVKALYH